MGRFLRFKEPVNTWTHLVTAMLAAVGMVFLIIGSADQAGKVVAMVVYGISMIVLFMASSIYHAVDASEKVVLRLKKFDHVSIFLLIAGTYTPVFAFGLDGAWRVTMLAIVWGLAVFGMMLKMFFIGVPRFVSTLIYVGLGWIAVVPFYKLVETLPTGAIVLMVLGGVAYTVGAVIYQTKKLDFFPGKFGHHEIFHLFVSLGAGLHFAMIAKYIAFAI